MAMARWTASERSDINAGIPSAPPPPPPVEPPELLDDEDEELELELELDDEDELLDDDELDELELLLEELDEELDELVIAAKVTTALLLVTEPAELETTTLYVPAAAALMLETE